MTDKDLADLLEKRGPVPECFAGVLIGITEVERDHIVNALRGKVTFRTAELPRKLPNVPLGDTRRD